MAAAEHKKPEASCGNETRTWPVSLLDCFQGTPETHQLPWPWLMFKALFCPASVLGSNETLFQGEEPADVCCLQPYSFCGPTCRGLNSQLCGLGNQGLKLCVHTCVLQAACSCFCLGLPYVAWLAALQRQRVMAKHGVAVTDEEAWATACYPCSLLQMHTLLQQQQQQHYHCTPSHQQQHQQASVPLRAPKLQQMKAATSDAPSQASSQAGPLTSAMTNSKVLRTVRDHSAQRSESAVTPGGQRSRRTGLRGSQDSEGSSDASETGVVNSPALDKPQRTSESQLRESSRSIGGASRGDVSARNSHRHTSARTSSDGASSRVGKQRPVPPGTSYLRPPPPAAQQQQQAPQQLGPLMSARSQSSSGGAGVSSQQQMLPPRAATARHTRTVSLGGEDSATGPVLTSAAADGRCVDACGVPAPGSALQTPEPSSSSGMRSNKRKLPGRAALASQSCHLPNSIHSSSNLQGLQNGIPSTPPQPSVSASASGAATCGPAFGAGLGALDTPAASSTAALQHGGVTPSAGLHGPQLASSCSKVSALNSCSRLVAFSQEDVPLSAFKPNPGACSRRASVAASAACELSKSAGGSMWQEQGTKPGSLASSMQQHTGCSSAAAIGKQTGSTTGSGGSGDAYPQQLQQQQQEEEVDGVGPAAAPAGLAALVSVEVNPQYATMQSDICNFASWMGEAPAGLASHSIQAYTQQEDSGCSEQQQQQQQGGAPSQQQSEGDLCMYEEASSPSAVSPKEAVSPGALSPSEGTASGAHTAAEAAGPGRGREGAAAHVAAGTSSRPAVLAAAWAYMSDMCNLGGSFDTASSTIGRSGLAAAVLSKLAEEGSSLQQELSGGVAGTACDARPSSSSDGSDAGRPAAGTAAAAAAAGSWPEAAPSPPFATLAAGHGRGTASKLPPLGTSITADASEHEDEGDSSPPRRRRRGADGGAVLPRLGSTASSSSAGMSPPEAASAGSTGGSAGGSGGQGGGRTKAAAAGLPAGPAGAKAALDRLDPQLLAAVTGNTDRDLLTASQEELAAKLARLAFANPAAARQLAGARQQQQQQQQQQQIAPDSSGGGAGYSSGGMPGRQQQQHFYEPFCPTMMSDMCNLAEPDGVDEQQHMPLSREGSQGFSAAASAAGNPQQQQQQQQWQPAGQARSALRTSGKPPVPPQSAAAAAGSYSKPNMPGRPMRQTQQQQRQQQQYTSPGAASRLGRPLGSTQAAPAGTATAAAVANAAAAGSSDTAGPLRAALLLRGMRASPGGPRLAGGIAAAAAAGPGDNATAAAGGLLSRRMPCPGDAAGDTRVAAAVAAGGSSSGGGGGAQYTGGAGDESLVSFDSYYLDCDLRHLPEAGLAAVEAANMITNNPLYTLAGSDNGGTADSMRFSPRLKQQLRDAGVGGGTAAASRPAAAAQQQRQGGTAATTAPRVTGAKGAPGGTAAELAAGRVAAAVAHFEARAGSGSDHDDGAQQLDNSRSNSPAPMYAGDAAVYAAAGVRQSAEKGLGKGMAGREYARGADASAGSPKGASLHGSRDSRQFQSEFDAAGRD